jgi:GTP-binding protein
VDDWLRRLRRDAPYLEWADIVFASGLTGQRVEKILREARLVAEERYRRVPTADVNRVIGDAAAAHPPPTARGKRARILYATQVAVAPPTFVVFVNDPELFHFSYRRYLENRLRDAFGFAGTPIRIFLRARQPGEGAPRRRRAGGARASAR